MSVLTSLKRGLKWSLMRSGALRAAGRWTPPGAVVLLYHSVRPDRYAQADVITPEIVHSAATFATQMEILAREFQPVTLDDVGAFLRQGKKLPRRAVAVTFDDGFRDNYEVAHPILTRHGIRATFYLTAGDVERGSTPWFCLLRFAFRTATVAAWRDPFDGHVWDLTQPAFRAEACLAAMRRCATMTGQRQQAWGAACLRELRPAGSVPTDLMLTLEQARALAQAGHRVGSHTMCHPNVAHLSGEEAQRELQDSKRLLEEQLDQPVEHFSYPCAILWPHWSPQTVQLTAAAGYQMVTTTASGTVRAQRDPRLIPRVAAPMDLDEFRWAVEASLLGRRV